jgi:hypothetical protein
MSFDDSIPASREGARVDRNTAQHRILQMVAREVVNRIRSRCGKSPDNRSNSSARDQMQGAEYNDNDFANPSAQTSP